MKKLTIIKLSFLVAVAFFFFGIVLFYFLYFNHLKSRAFFYDSCNKVWAHRGYFEAHEQNSISAFRAAVELGARGVELDIYYDEKIDDYVVSHDYPYNLKEGRLLLLSDVFGAVGDIYFWLDFKNLKKLPKDKLNKAFNRLEKIVSNFNNKNRIIVESQNVESLRHFTTGGFNTSYWINYRGGGVKELYGLKLLYIMGHFSSISMDYRRYNHKLKEAMPRLPILLFTVNDFQTVNRFVENESVKIILSDKNFYSLENEKCMLQLN